MSAGIGRLARSKVLTEYRKPYLEKQNFLVDNVVCDVEVDVLRNHSTEGIAHPDISLTWDIF